MAETTATKRGSGVLPRRVLVIAAGLWLAFLAAAVAFYFKARPTPSAAPAEPALPVLYTIAPFRFTDQNGQPYASDALKGKVWAANFIFTRCPSICPLFTKKMAEVQKGTAGLGEAVHLVSFSVDPAYDTPAVLKAYAEEHHADPTRWTFLTGDREALTRTIMDQMKIHVSEETTDLMALAHGGHFVLVDGRMQIRGYYNSEDEDAVGRLVHDAELLAQEEASR